MHPFLSVQRKSEDVSKVVNAVKVRDMCIGWFKGRSCGTLELFAKLPQELENEKLLANKSRQQKYDGCAGRNTADYSMGRYGSAWRGVP